MRCCYLRVQKVKKKMIKITASRKHNKIGDNNNKKTGFGNSIDAQMKSTSNINEYD